MSILDKLIIESNIINDPFSQGTATQSPETSIHFLPIFKQNPGLLSEPHEASLLEIEQIVRFKDLKNFYSSYSNEGKELSFLDKVRIETELMQDAGKLPYTAENHQVALE